MDVTELKVILDQHKLWIESDHQEGKRANLRGANLRGANLRGANLQSAYLMGAYLQSANLMGAYLQSANLQSADLEGADLQDANLRGANLRGAYLRGANLQGATFDLNFKKVINFRHVTFSEDQIAWVCLHPKYHEWADSLKWMKAERLSA